jgi:hypothetical protein
MSKPSEQRLFFLSQIEKCVRLAGEIQDEHTARVLSAMAAEYRAQLDKLNEPQQ